MNDIQTTINYMPQIIGIAGTIFGTILGWALSYCTGCVGRIKVFLDSFESKKSQSGEYAYISKLFIYNTSQQTKYIRDLNILFCDSNKQVLIHSKPYNGICDFNNIGSKIKNKDTINGISLQGKDSVELSLSDIVKDKSKWYNTTKILLSYKYKNKMRKKLIIKKFVPSNVKASSEYKFL